MNFDFSEDQKFLKDQARKFLEDKSSRTEVRSVMDNNASCHEALWAGIKEMGWLGTAIPEEFGGLGLGYLELCVIAEELGRALAPTPFASSIYLAAEAILRAGSDDQKNQYLPGFASGEIVGCLAASEKSGALTAKNVSCAFDGSTVTGKKIAVVDGDVASHAVVLVKSASGHSLVLVDLKGKGVTVERTRALDLTRSQATITFDGAPGELLGKDGAGFDILDTVFNSAAILFAFEQVGGAEAALEDAKAYALDRFAFGRPIAGYQAIKHKLADAYIKNTIAKSNAYFGAWALSTDAAELPVAAAGARVAANEAYWYASKENIQTHGGMGYTWEFDCHLHYRRAQVLGLVIGGDKVWKNKLVTALERQNSAAA